jgi:predicted dehydrogenase
MQVIQVGMGGMGNAWLRAVTDSIHVQYSGFVEVNDEIAQHQVDAWNLDSSTVYSSLHEALAGVKADGVINVTPPQFHKEISIAALEAGIPVLSEKPLADTIAAAQEIVDVSNRTGVLHMVAQNYRYRSATQTLKRALDAGICGAVGSLAVEFYKGPHFGGFRDKMAYPLIIDMAIHHFDLMRFFLGSNAVAIKGRSWNPPWSWYAGDASAAVLLEFASGIHVSYDGSWCSQARRTGWNANWRFECANGVITMIDDVVTVETLDPQAEALGIEPAVGEPQIVAPVQMAREGQAYLLHEFYDAVSQGKPPATTCQDNINSLEIVFETITAFGR